MALLKTSVKNCRHQPLSKIKILIHQRKALNELYIDQSLLVIAKIVTKEVKCVLNFYHTKLKLLEPISFG